MCCVHVLTIHIFVQTNDVHILFKEMDPKKMAFTLMHCYVELEKYPKWQTRENEVSQKKKQKNTVDASPGTTSCAESFVVGSDALEDEERPTGTKKEKLRRAKEHASEGNACKFSLQTVWTEKKEKDEIKEIAKNARYARAFEMQEKELALKERDDARKQFELEERIMLIDTSAMTVAQKQFYEDKQTEIIARRRH